MINIRTWNEDRHCLGAGINNGNETDLFWYKCGHFATDWLRKPGDVEWRYRSGEPKCLICLGKQPKL